MRALPAPDPKRMLAFTDRLALRFADDILRQSVAYTQIHDIYIYMCVYLKYIFTYAYTSRCPPLFLVGGNACCCHDKPYDCQPTEVCACFWIFHAQKAGCGCFWEQAESRYVRFALEVFIAIRGILALTSLESGHFETLSIRIPHQSVWILQRTSPSNSGIARKFRWRLISRSVRLKIHENTSVTLIFMATANAMTGSTRHTLCCAAPHERKKGPFPQHGPWLLSEIWIVHTRRKIVSFQVLQMERSKLNWKWKTIKTYNST